MNEIIEFRLNNKYAHLLLGAEEIESNASNTVIKICRDDPKFERIRILNEKIKKQQNDFLFLYSNVKRKYEKEELEKADLFQMIIKTTFEPAGEECGTLYDDKLACPICGANRIQINSLKLKKSSVPKKDIARTIAGEVLVSKRLRTLFEERLLTGAKFDPVFFGDSVADYYQLTSQNELELSKKVLAGVDVFDFSEGSDSLVINLPKDISFDFKTEIYKCPLGHTIGLNLLSEAYIMPDRSLDNADLFFSRQKIGVKRGLLVPEPIYLCSPAFKKMVENEDLSGFEFEIAHIEN